MTATTWRLTRDRSVTNARPVFVLVRHDAALVVPIAQVRTVRLDALREASSEALRESAPGLRHDDA